MVKFRKIDGIFFIVEIIKLDLVVGRLNYSESSRSVISTPRERIQKKVENFSRSSGHPIYRSEDPILRGAESRLQVLQTVLQFLQTVVLTVGEDGYHAVQSCCKVKVKRLEDIVQERNEGGEGQVPEVTPGGEGEMVERLQEVVKYQICPIVTSRPEAPQEQQIF